MTKLQFFWFGVACGSIGSYLAWNGLVWLMQMLYLDEIDLDDTEELEERR